MKLFGSFLMVVFAVMMFSGCGESREQQINKWIGELGKGRLNAASRDAVVRQLVAQGEDAVPYLMDSFKNTKDPMRRRYCAIALAKIGADEALPLIKNMLANDENEENRSYGAEALVIMKKEKAVPELVEAMKKDKSVVVRTSIREQLSKKKLAPAARTLLLPYLKEQDVTLRSEAREIIVSMGPSSVPDLIKMLETDDKDLVTEVFRALVAIHDPSAKPAMKDTMKRFPVWDDKEEKVKNKFYRLLESMYNEL